MTARILDDTWAALAAEEAGEVRRKVGFDREQENNTNQQEERETHEHQEG